MLKDFFIVIVSVYYCIRHVPKTKDIQASDRHQDNDIALIKKKDIKDEAKIKINQALIADNTNSNT